MQNLVKYIDLKNSWNRITGQPLKYNMPLSQADADAIADELDCDLSPENLHCDGEISAAEANRKYRFYQKVAQDLSKYCAKNKLAMPTIYEI